MPASNFGIQVPGKLRMSRGDACEDGYLLL
jgi:hypothetical protein